MAAKDMFSVNELYPEQLERQPVCAGVVQAVDAARAAEGIFTYTVTIEHPVTHCASTIYGVVERVDEFYRNQAGRIPVGARVHVQREVNGIWEIIKALPAPQRATDASPETRISIGKVGDDRGHIVANDELVELQLGSGDSAAVIRANADNVELTAGEWTEVFDQSNWYLSNNQIRFETVASARQQVGGGTERYSVFRVIDPSRTPATNVTLHAAMVNPDALLQTDTTSVTIQAPASGSDFDTHVHTAEFVLPVQVSSLIQTDLSGVLVGGQIPQADPNSRVWGPPRLLTVRYVHDPFLPDRQRIRYTTPSSPRASSAPFGVPVGWTGSASDYANMRYQLESKALYRSNSPWAAALDIRGVSVPYLTVFAGARHSAAPPTEGYRTTDNWVDVNARDIISRIANGAGAQFGTITSAIGDAAVHSRRFAIGGVAPDLSDDGILDLQPILQSSTGTAPALSTILSDAGVQVEDEDTDAVITTLTGSHFELLVCQAFRLTATHPNYGKSVPQESFIIVGELSSGYRMAAAP